MLDMHTHGISLPMESDMMCDSDALIPRETDRVIIVGARLGAEDMIEDITIDLAPRETVYKVVRVAEDGCLKSAIAGSLMYGLNWTIAPQGLLFAWSTLEAARKFVEAKMSLFQQPLEIYEASAAGTIIHHDGQQRAFSIGAETWIILGPLCSDMVLCMVLRLDRKVERDIEC